ncbi:hypothetical protein KC318_g2642 [Hortaea werneckii]|nr:hypothetical protein KC334_g5549 [Hortaea werneckii]KAI7017895.1 hypothetical protein KC355_g3522 [Hortaea werneckii]KAI7672784.1 hypothetical protein KC318_g2642 [Hortaea werneckii]
MAANATDSTSQAKPGLLIFKLCGSIEHLIINDPQEWLSTFGAGHEREDRIARRLALCPQTHALRFHLEGEDCDETRPFDDLEQSFGLRDLIDRVIFLHTTQRERPASDGNGQPEAIVVDYSGEQAVDRSKQGSKATTKRGPDRQDERSGTKATSSKSADAGPAPAAESHAAVDSYVPSYSQDRTLAGSQKSAKPKPAPVGDGKASRTASSDRTHQNPYSARDKPFKSENQTREAKVRKTHDALKEAGEARHASRKQPRKDRDGDKLEKDTTLDQKTPVSEGKKSVKERQKLSADVNGKKPMREPGLGGAATQPTTAPSSKKRKQEKGTSDSGYVYDGESGGQSPKKRSKTDKGSGKSKVTKKPR